MTATRSRKEEMYYRNYRKTRRQRSEGCQFCAIKRDDGQFVRATRNFMIIKNIFEYSLWDGQPVADHLMIIPKQHTDTLADLSDKAAVEYVKLIAWYETNGYNIYARTPVSTIKSVIHQHTHLIKPAGKSRRFLLFLQKPYVRLSR